MITWLFEVQAGHRGDEITNTKIRKNRCVEEPDQSKSHGLAVEQPEGSRFESSSRPSCEEFACAPCACTGFLVCVCVCLCVLWRTNYLPKCISAWWPDTAGITPAPQQAWVDGG